ncbi:hypothetical protein K1719_034790 [Acacia pycnantha]|nr:hypothetical protein K1719_034790 [Acacia pycnantha]
MSHGLPTLVGVERRGRRKRCAGGGGTGSNDEEGGRREEKGRKKMPRCDDKLGGVARINWPAKASSLKYGAKIRRLTIC